MPRGATARQALPRCKSPCQVSAVGAQGRAGVAALLAPRVRACVKGSFLTACVAALAGNAGSALIMPNCAKLGPWTAVGRAVRAPVEEDFPWYVSISVRSPHCVQRAPKGSSCPVLHIIGLTGLFSGALSACQRKRLSRHDVKLTSFKSHSALGGQSQAQEKPYQ